MPKDGPPRMTMAGNMPRRDDHSGVEALRPELVREPGKLRYAVVAYDASYVKTETDSGEATPTLRIRRFEPAEQEADRKEAAELLDRLNEARIGALPLNGGDEEPGEEDDPEQ